MVKELKLLKEDVEKAIGRVAAEYSYTRDLQDKIEQIEKEAEESDAALRDAKKGFRILRWIGRAERRVDQSEIRIIDELKELGKILPKNLKEKEEELLKGLEIAEAKLVKAASMFTGGVREDLLNIQTDEQLLKKLKSKGNEKIKVDLQNCFTKAKNGIKDLEKWLSATEAILKNIKGFEETLERLAA
ncbi:MAG: hypothetical protein ABH824_03490 [Nanoarchaeota archaeon]|nr:hypothetical protein [Nanoarchaeota archaeon]MBU1632222.1 hypothetical protein [Nanoarchaeota archaeon]MBU1875516.1 hypothetical protein [Nanoarchaeota archaeon]